MRHPRASAQARREELQRENKRVQTRCLVCSNGINSFCLLQACRAIQAGSIFVIAGRFTRARRACRGTSAMRIAVSRLSVCSAQRRFLARKTSNCTYAWFTIASATTSVSAVSDSVRVRISAAIERACMSNCDPPNAPSAASDSRPTSICAITFATVTATSDHSSVLYANRRLKPRVIWPSIYHVTERRNTLALNAHKNSLFEKD